jgi:hypothetical protein
MISFALEDKTAYESTSTYEEQPAVYVTKYGDCYHSITCHYLTQSMIEKGLYEARDKGYRACSYCGGQSCGTTVVEHKTYYEIKDYSNAITYSLLRSIAYTAILYLIVLWILQQRKLNEEEG